MMSESRISIGKSTYTYLNSLEQRLEDEKHVSINERIGLARYDTKALQISQTRHALRVESQHLDKTFGNSSFILLPHYTGLSINALSWWPLR